MPSPGALSGFNGQRSLDRVAPRTVPRLLRFSGAVERDPAIDAWLDAQRSELASIAKTWFTLMRQCGGDVRELMHDGYATVCVADAPFAYVGVFTAHVNVGFFQGAALPDPAGLLQGTGKYMRHVKIRPNVPFDNSSLAALVTAAYRDIVARGGLQSSSMSRSSASGSS
jgi:hypothetical protein